MADAEGVVFALGAQREGRQAAVLLDGVQLFAPAREYLVRVGLVADIPDQAVVRGVVDVVQRNGQFDRAEAGGEVAAAGADGLDQELAQLGCQVLETPFRERSQIRGGRD